jgi:hypothetical protein
MLWRQLFCGVLCILSACTGVVVESTQDLNEQGITYFLPRTLLDIYIRTSDIAQGEKDPAALQFLMEDVQYYITVTSTSIPDPTQQYILKYNKNVFFHDRVCVSTTANGLLSSVEIGTEDATPQILVTLAALLQTAGGIVPGGPAFGPGPPAQKAFVRVTIDPFDLNSVARANLAIKQALKLSRAVKLDTSFLRHLGGNDIRSCQGQGVCFRTTVKMPFAVLHQATDNSVKYETVSPTVYVDVVNLKYVGYMNLERAALVENLTGLGFQGGALTQVTMRRPSQALQAVKLPLAIADAILAVPGNLLGRASGSATALNALNTETNNRTSIENATQTRLTAIEQELSTRASGTSTELTVFQPKCNGVLTGQGKT